jgi:hypothetical protein
LLTILYKETIGLHILTEYDFQPFFQQRLSPVERVKAALGYKMKAYQNIFSAGCLVVLMLGTALAGTSSSSACKTGHYRADFNTLKIAQLKPLNIHAAYQCRN